MGKLLGNWQTTLIGFVGAVVLYFVNLGPNLPHSGTAWGHAPLSAVLAGLGIVAKDAQTGSPPGATQ